LFAGYVGASLTFYLLVLKWRGPAAHVTTQTRWDLAIPFCPEWVWLYLLPYLAGPLLAMSLTPETLTWFLRRASLALVLSLMVFILWPTKTVRPPTVPLDEGLTARLYRNMASIDEPAANAAPSLHVSISCLLLWALIRDFPRWWPASLAAFVVVCLSTLLTWQHHLLDVGTGTLLGCFCALPGPRRAQNPAPLP
jgi:membrane-associated phospholipid phosphatase